MGRRDLDPGKLLTCGPIVVHVAHGTHAVRIVRSSAVRRLKISLRAGGAWRHRARARLAGQRDQRDRTFARSDRFGGVSEMDQIGATAGIRGIDMAHLQAEIIDHRQRAARRVAGAEIAVNIGLGQPGVFDRAFGDLSVQLRSGFVGCVPGRMLIDAGNVGLALDGQIASPLAFLFSCFSGLSRPPWQAANIPHGETRTTSSGAWATASGPYGSRRAKSRSSP